MVPLSAPMCTVSILVHEDDGCHVADILKVLSRNLSLWLCKVIFRSFLTPWPAGQVSSGLLFDFMQTCSFIRYKIGWEAWPILHRGLKEREYTASVWAAFLKEWWLLTVQALTLCEFLDWLGSGIGSLSTFASFAGPLFWSHAYICMIESSQSPVRWLMQTPCWLRCWHWPWDLNFFLMCCIALAQIKKFNH